jgi:2-dehydro-3-deoxyphosphooctonate aldolase (KDO 8-P synthase)
MNQKTILIDGYQDYKISNKEKITIIAGPCQMESEDHSMMIAGKMKEICDKLKINYIFKASFDKANRTSIYSKRGIGIDKSLPIFEKIKKEFNIPVLTDVHESSHCNEIKDVIDIIQIPAFLCRQTNLLIAAAQTGKIVNVKKGQFVAPNDVSNIVKKIEESGSNKILLTERGSSFGYNNLVVDMRSFPIMSKTGYPVIFDATHATQAPAGLGNASGGDRTMAPYLAKAAVACGIAGLFMEVHEDPDNAPSDGPCMIKLHEIESTLQKIVKIDEIVKMD